MEYSCITDIGLIREKNQDSYIAAKNKFGDILAIVSDGIGGGKSGEVASSEVVKYFNEVFNESGPFSSIKNVADYISYHINKVNKIVYGLSLSNEKYTGMGTTLTGVLITSYGTVCFNCGDSRVYGFLDNKIFQLTKDHTLVNQMLDKGQISPSEALNHPKKHYLVKAIGIFDKISFDVFKVKDLDYYLVCSDGVHGYICDEEINSVVTNEFLTLKDKVKTLKDIALLKGGYDNITAILIKR